MSGLNSSAITVNRSGVGFKEVTSSEDDGEPNTTRIFYVGKPSYIGRATTATIIVTNTVRSVSGFSAKWFGLFVAQFVCIGGAIYVGKAGADLIIGVLNGCLVYLSAVGAMAVGGTDTGDKEPRRKIQARKKIIDLEKQQLKRQLAALKNDKDEAAEEALLKARLEALQAGKPEEGASAWSASAGNGFWARWV